MQSSAAPDLSRTSSGLLIGFIVNSFAGDGVHVLTLGHGTPVQFGFGRYRGEAESNPLALRSFLSSVHDRVCGRDGFMSLLTLTSVLGVVPESGTRVLNFADLRGTRLRFGWLLDAARISPLSRSSLGTMLPRERGVKLKDSAFPSETNSLSI